MRDRGRQDGVLPDRPLWRRWSLAQTQRSPMTPLFALLLFRLLRLLVVGSDEAIKVDFGPGGSADTLEALLRLSC